MKIVSGHVTDQTYLKLFSDELSVLKHKLDVLCKQNPNFRKQIVEHLGVRLCFILEGILIDQTKRDFPDYPLYLWHYKMFCLQEETNALPSVKELTCPICYESLQAQRILFDGIDIIAEKVKIEQKADEIAFAPIGALSIPYDWEI